MREFSVARSFLVWNLVLGPWLFACHASAAEPFIPRKQTKPPTPALSPAEAIAKMTVPPGFTVELVAAEPDVVNPVAMTFDERGRIWITESFEYPRKQAGPGRDRVKILEDVDGDGTAEHVSIFAEGLNIPSGIAVGAGGVWVANAPDILFYPDADRDGRADGPPQQVLTGFGRDDTHELPNSLTWGPDGWLYGLNGVFNVSHVRYGKDNAYLKPAEKEKHPGWKITCAMFRIHPRSREFQVFCEGTSNPWGIAFNDNGDAFVSACVIDHLWHLVETGYYHRQGGPYPPHTWKLESIVDYKHQMAAYCGITWFDSDAYPEQYRKKLYMGNIHGGCINVDGLERHGATYKGVKHDDFLAANDVWFMPVVQKVGPDGCLYILDWYDRYHCYQDANADPKGVDRAKGRLYRVRYKETPRAPKFDVAAETDDQLIERLASPNIFYREQAQRVLAERLRVGITEQKTLSKLENLILATGSPASLRRHSIWSLIGGGKLREDLLLALRNGVDDSPTYAWGIRAAGDTLTRSEFVRDEVANAASAADPSVRLQAAIAARKLSLKNAIPHMMQAAELSHDALTTPVIWQNLKLMMQSDTGALVEYFSDPSREGNPASALVLLRYYDWLLSRPEGVATLAKLIVEQLDSSDGVVSLLPSISAAIRDGQLSSTQQSQLRSSIERKLTEHFDRKSDLDSALILTHWGNRAATQVVTEIAISAASHGTTSPDAAITAAIDTWIRSPDANVAPHIEGLLRPSQTSSVDHRRRLLDSLVRSTDEAVGDQVLNVYARLEAELKPAAIELLTSRSTWSKQLLDAIKVGRISKDAVTVNQVRKLLKLGDKELTSRVEATWGKLRTDRNPQREQVVAQMRDLVRNGHGDPVAGQAVFGRLCGQCHKIHGQGQDVGPDITVNGRSNFEQLLSNIFDPSLVIGAAYQPRIVSTGDGRVLTGLLVEDGPQRVVLKLQGGKLETIPRSNVDEIETSRLSLMPEGVETQYKPQEIIDLFAFLKLDRPPQDPQAKTLPGFAELDARKK
jgi:putative membrane-bound dehydrogenase-like protein